MKRLLLLLLFMLGLVLLSGCSFNQVPDSHIDDNILCDPINGSDCMGVDKGRGETVVRPQEKLVRYLEFSQLTSGAISLNESAVIDNRWVLLESGHGVIAGDRLAIIDGTRIYGGFTTSVIVGQNVSLDTPIDFNYSVQNSTAVTLTRDLNIDGSVTPQIFQIGTIPGVSLDITRLVFEMTDATAGDDTTFGGCPALTNGLVLRFVNGATYNIWNVKTNSEIKKIAGGDFVYEDKAGPGDFGFSARATINGQDKLDTIIKIEGTDMLQAIVQDDLTCLTKFELGAQGNTDLMTLE